MRSKLLFAAFLLLTLLHADILSAQWQFAKSAGGNKDDIGNSIAMDGNGFVYVGGTFSSSNIVFGSTTLINDSAGTNDIFLVKYDSSGNVIWARREGGKGDDLLNAITADSTGNVFITGNFTSPSVAFDTFMYYSHGCPRFFVAKYNTAGTLNWARSYDTAYNWPGCPETYSNSIVADAYGHIFLSVYFVGTMVLGHDTLQTSLYDRYESLVMKYDYAGNLMFETQIHSEPYTFVVVSAISADALGSIYAAGYTNGNILYADPISSSGGGYSEKRFILKLDSSGHGRYISKIYYETCCDNVLSMAVGSLNQVYPTGYFGSATKPDLVMGTHTLHNYSPGTSDIFLAQFDSTCNVVWIKQAGGDNDDRATSISVRQSGVVYISGSFKSAMASFDTKTVTNSAVTNLFFAAYDSSGNALYAEGGDGIGNNMCNSIVAAPSNVVYTTGGFYSDSINFGAYHLANPYSITNDFFIARYHEAGIEAVPMVTTREKITVFPNPVLTPGCLHITFPAKTNCNSIELFNTLGMSVFSSAYKGNCDNLEFNLPALPGGFYYLKIYGTINSFSVPLIVGE